ncbi:Fimbrial Usher protein [compost metagenome]
MQEVLDTYSHAYGLIERRRNRMELTMSQSIGQNLGTLMLSTIREDYWNSDRAMASWSLGYNNGWRGINYGLTYTYSKNGSSSGRGEQTYYEKD